MNKNMKSVLYLIFAVIMSLQVFTQDVSRDLSIISFKDEPDPFSPNNDGVKDINVLTADIQVRAIHGLLSDADSNRKDPKRFFFVSEQAIFNPQGKKVRVINVSNEIFPLPRPSNTNKPTDQPQVIRTTIQSPWDGKDSAGFTLPDGAYSYEFKVTLVRENPQAETKVHQELEEAGPVQGQITLDLTPPTINIESPKNGETIDTNTPLIKISYFDKNGLELSSFKAQINGNDITAKFTIGANQATFQVPKEAPLSEGKNTLTASIRDIAGNFREAISTFTILIKPPPTAGFINGIVFDSATNQPLAGALITAVGERARVFSSQDGRFSFPTSGTGIFIIKIEKEGFTFVQRRAEVISTRDTAVDPVFLTPLDPKVTTITPAGGTATNSDGSIEMIFPEGAASRTINVVATKLNKARDLPNPLPFPSFFTYAANFKPDGERFNKPVTCRIKNHRGFAPGTPIPVGFWNKDSFSWEDAGMGRVTSDGQFVEFQITHFSSYDINLTILQLLQASESVVFWMGGGDNPDPGNECTKVADGSSWIGVKRGVLFEDHALPSIRSLGITPDIALNYNNLTANPSVTLSATSTFNLLLVRSPQTLSARFNIEGVIREAHFRPTPPWPSFFGHLSTMQKYLFDAINARGEPLKTGTYFFTLDSSNNYQGTFATAAFFAGPPLQDTGVTADDPVSRTFTARSRFTINNQINSHFGAGWTLSNLSRLHFEPDGTILITRGDHSAKIFFPIRAAVHNGNFELGTLEGFIPNGIKLGFARVV